MEAQQSGADSGGRLGRRAPRGAAGFGEIVGPALRGVRGGADGGEEGVSGRARREGVLGGAELCVPRRRVRARGGRRRRERSGGRGKGRRGGGGGVLPPRGDAVADGREGGGRRGGHCFEGRWAQEVGKRLGSCLPAAVDAG